TQRLNLLTSNLLQMTRLQSAEIGLQASPLSAPDMIGKVIAHARRESPARNIVFKPEGREITVSVDVTLFDLALTNVVQNALRYSPADSRVVIGCGVEGGQCLISVTDEGIGIAPEEQERVFERFYRVQRSDGGARGTGLGLAIAKGFVKASGGSIAIISPVAHGAGTTIAIRLPMNPMPER
ncbi:MAG TPA: ATP-binding protein, partial [Novosphingobium sp.]|nr:ATP-binding protein [Novosphingobium sp.]